MSSGRRGSSGARRAERSGKKLTPNRAVDHSIPSHKQASDQPGARELVISHFKSDLAPSSGDVEAAGRCAVRGAIFCIFVGVVEKIAPAP